MHVRLQKMASVLLSAVLVLAAISLPQSALAATTTGYLWPVPSTKRALSRGYFSGHSGLDIAVASGTDVYATKAGTVYYVYTGCNSVNAASTGNTVSCSSSTCNPSSKNFQSYTNGSKSYKTCNYGYGNGVVIKHTDGTYSMYAHMSTVSVSKGATVTQGQKIGTSGSSGNSTGAHLHFELSAGMSMSGAYCNPSSSINNNPKYASYQITSSNKSGLTTSGSYVYNSSGVEYTFSTSGGGGTVADCDCSTSAAGYYTCTAPSALAMHSSHDYNSSSDIGNDIPKGAIVWVSKAATGSATYAHVTYNGKQGIASKNYLSLVPSYTLTFNANGGSGGPGSAKVWANVGDYSVVSVPSRDNYTFNGWYTAASGGTKVYDANGRCTNEGTFWKSGLYVGGKSATLYAQWTINTIYVTGVSLNADYIDLTQGETRQLTATVTPSNATYQSVNWTSGDTTVATVSASGLITAVAPGTAVVSASASDGSGHFAMCIVNVYPYVEDLELNRHSMYVSTREPFTQTRLTASVVPSSASEYVVWSSSDPFVVSVDADGLLTANEEGTVTITASVVNGPSDSCIVRVLESLDTVFVPDGTTVLEDSALEDIGTEAVILPQGMTTLGSRALASNSKLKFVFLPDQVSDISQDAFDGDPYLTLVVGNDRDVSRFGIPYVTNADASIVTARAISLPSSATLYAGEQTTLAPVFTPTGTTNQGITWSSSDPSIAAVNANGVVTGMDIGSATITATTVDGTNLRASTVIQVTVPDVKVSAYDEEITTSDFDAQISAKLNISNVPSLYEVEMVGVEIYDIADTLLGRSFGAWDAIGCNAADVIGRNLTPSTVYGIRYIAIVGGYTFRSEKKEFVTADPIARIVLSDTNLTLALGESAHITAEILNHDPDDIVWRSSNSSVVSVIDGDVTGTKAGTATITARLAGDTDVMASCVITVTGN